MNADDYAILIGIDRYPLLGKANSPANLRGPRNDVDAVKRWLLDPGGGGLPGEQNLFQVDLPAEDDVVAARPTLSELENLIADIDALGRARTGGDAGTGRPRRAT